MKTVVPKSNTNKIMEALRAIAEIEEKGNEASIYIEDSWVVVKFEKELSASDKVKVLENKFIIHTDGLKLSLSSL